MKKNLLILVGGGGTEHEISFKTSDYIQSKVDLNLFNIFRVEIKKDKSWEMDGEKVELNFSSKLVSSKGQTQIHLALPCLHGYPGETGDIQSYFELIGLPYFGSSAEVSMICFNKLVTKLMLEQIGIKTSPFITINDESEIDKGLDFLGIHKTVYLKATNQGSSVGCYRITTKEELRRHLPEAFTLSPYVILEKEIKGRELEIAAYEYQGEVTATSPGEIVCSSLFYNYEEKYSQTSSTKTYIEATKITDLTCQEMKKLSIKAFKSLRLRHLARIDFFLTSNGEVYINEINTFPGHTPISMFPLMLENTGLSYQNYLNSHLQALVKK